MCILAWHHQILFIQIHSKNSLIQPRAQLLFLFQYIFFPAIKHASINVQKQHYSVSKMEHSVVLVQRFQQANIIVVREGKKKKKLCPIFQPLTANGLRSGLQLSVLFNLPGLFSVTGGNNREVIPDDSQAHGERRSNQLTGSLRCLCQWGKEESCLGFCLRQANPNA